MVSPLVALAIEPIDFGAQQGRLEATMASRQNRLFQPIEFQEQVRQFDRSAGQRDRSLDLTRRGQDIQVDQFDRQLLFDREKFEENRRQFGISSGLRARGLGLEERRLGLQEMELFSNLSQAEREAAAERATGLGNAAATLATFEDPASRFQAWQRLAPTLAEAGFEDLVGRIQSPEQLTDDVLRTVIAQSSEALDQLEGAGLGPTTPGEAPVTSFDEFVNAGPEPLTAPSGVVVPPGGRVQLDRRNPDDAAFLRQRGNVLQQAPTRQETGQPGSFTFTDPVDDADARTVANVAGIPPEEIERRGGTVPDNASDLAAQQASVASFTSAARDLQNLVRSNPQITGFSGGVLSAANAIRAEVEGFAQAMGTQLDASTDPAAYEDVFREVGIDNARLRSAVTNLGYALAISQENSGRLSDNDVRMAIRQIGGDASDPQVLISTVDDVARRLDERFRFAFRQQTGLDPQPADRLIERDLLGGATIEELPAAEVDRRVSALTPDQIARFSTEQLEAIRAKLAELGEGN